MIKREKAKLAKYRAQTQALLEALDDLYAYLVIGDDTPTPFLNKEVVLEKVREATRQARDQGTAAYLEEYGASQPQIARGCKDNGN